MTTCPWRTSPRRLRPKMRGRMAWRQWHSVTGPAVCWGVCLGEGSGGPWRFWKSMWNYCKAIILLCLVDIFVKWFCCGFCFVEKCGEVGLCLHGLDFCLSKFLVTRQLSAETALQTQLMDIVVDRGTSATKHSGDQHRWCLTVRRSRISIVVSYQAQQHHLGLLHKRAKCL